MRHLLIASVMVLTSTATAAVQTQQPAFSTAPLTVTFVDAQLEDALAFIARMAGITIEFDATVTDEMRRAKLSPERLKMVNVTVEEALATVTSQNGLTYTVIGPKAIRISKKP